MPFIPTESTPLLHDTYDEETLADDIYDRFPHSTKHMIVMMVSMTGLLPLLVSGTLIPSIPQMAEDLNTTAEVISFAVSVSLMVVSVGSLVWASYSSFYGRRPVYILGLPFLILGSLGVGLSQNVTELMWWRIVQAFGSAGGLSLGAGVIGDTFRLEERGAAMGVYFSAMLLGPALAPAIGGFATNYASWRVMQYIISITAAVVLIIMLIFFPETMHPNESGLEKLNATLEKPRRYVFVNPLQCLTTLRAPTLFALVISTLAALTTFFIMLVPMAYTIGGRYGITNEFFAGICFIPWGIGSMFGASIVGRISDRLIMKWKKRRGGVWMPEDRLRSATPAAFTFVPLSILASGLIIQYIDGILGLVLNIVCIFFNGVGVNMVMAPLAAYGVDVMHSRSAETLAATSAVRGVLLALIVTGIIPSIKVNGTALTSVMGAAFAWVGAILIWITVRYGEQLRNWSNVEYSIQ